MENIIEMLNIRKVFPGVIANDDITLELRRGEIHAWAKMERENRL